MLLYLLERDVEGGLGSVEIGGNHWRLVAYDLDASDAQDLAFICVSYTWGEGREPSPFHPSFDVSDRTIPALTVIVSQRPSSARIWIDAFCVPLDNPERALTLESMGYIYSRASEVIVVLSNAARPVLDQMRTSYRLDSIYLDVLERDEWVSRAWTYQEAVNSHQNLFITCDDPHGAIVDGIYFLNCLGYNLSRSRGLRFASDKRQRYPRLDAFEDLIADYMTGYQERSALQVMSNMDRRVQRRREDHFYAMIGAISTARASSCETSDPCEAFMLVCERKGDYSFIYSAAKRDSTQFRRWRPVSGDLPSILPWQCSGEGQPAHKESEFLYLDQMMLLENLSMDREGEKYVESWLELSKVRSVGSPESLQESAYAALQFMGFKGSPDCISTTHGLFFPCERISSDEETTILVATQVGWAFGAPGIARCYGNAELYTPGVFVGRIDNAVATSVKMS
ncbi:hypothetical protein DL771_007990 [Monosporascus sp. 5C6A]|nr:hypothetical protein DL771_007990 [Monosporascus sp. 5C6A]